MSAKKPRAAYCTGCGITFPKMHMMINHRRSKRCGGRYLPPEEQVFLIRLRLERENQLRKERESKEIAKLFKERGVVT